MQSEELILVDNAEEYYNKEVNNQSFNITIV